MTTASIPSVRWKPTRLGFAGFGLFIALVASALLSSEPSARLGAALGLLGVTAGALAAGAAVRTELAEESESVSLWRGVVTAIGSAGGIWLAMNVFFVAIWSSDATGRGGIAAAIVGAVALIAAIGYPARATLATEGLDREVLLRSASFAFFATVLASVSYGLFEALADAPRLSMWVVWSFGMVTWGIATGVVKRRMA